MPTSTPQQPTDDWQAAGALEGVDEDVLRAHSVRQLERVYPFPDGPPKHKFVLKCVGPLNVHGWS